MKRLLFVLLTLFLLVSCNNKVSTITEYSNYLNSKDVMILEYLESKVDKRINNRGTFSSNEKIETDNEYTVLVFDCGTYESLINLEILDHTYELLESKNKVIVMFINASNYDFLTGSKYIIPTNKTYIYLFQNFCYGNFITIVNGEINDNCDKYNMSIISSAYDIIVEHEKLL